MTEKRTWRLGEAFAHLAEDGGISPVPLGPDFWTSGVQSLPPGYLVSRMDLTSDWSTWEMHPAGDEFIYLLDGAMTLILETGTDPERVSLSAGDFTIVPAGIWHTADVAQPGQGLFITCGAGTQHRTR